MSTLHRGPDLVRDRSHDDVLTLVDDDDTLGVPAVADLRRQRELPVTGDLGRGGRLWPLQARLI